jgi:imidazolonepropionase-like amidohydrolase
LEAFVVRRAFLAAAACLSLAASLSAQSWCAPQKPDSGFVAFTGVTLWDGTGAAARTGTTVLIHGERITAVFKDGSEPLPAGTAVRALPGKFVIPGLIDAHVHVGSDVSGEDARVRADRRLCRALLGGITAARDMAGDTRAIASMQRDAKVGDIASPDLYFASLWAGPAFFSDPRTAQASAGEVPGTLPGMRAIDSTTDLRQAAAEARGTRATAIKLYAAMSPELVAAATAEAHRQQLLVWAHASIAGVSPLQMTRAGVDVLSHGPRVARELPAAVYDTLAKDSTMSLRGRFDTPAFDTLFAEMRRRGTIMEPTLFIYMMDGRERLGAIAAEVTRRASARGVMIVAGTDSLGSGDEGAWTLPNLHEELRLLVREAGLSNADALAASTRNAARAVGALAERGAVEPGKLADFVVLDADPVADIANTARIRAVVKRGAFYPGGPTLNH